MDVMRSSGMLGRLYGDGEVIVRQGELGECMYVVQEGKVEVLRRQGDKEYCLAVLGPGDFFGESTIFEKEVRPATVRSLDGAIVLKVEKKAFLQRVHEDPSSVFMLLRAMSQRIQQLEDLLMRVADVFPLETASLRTESRTHSPKKETA